MNETAVLIVIGASETDKQIAEFLKKIKELIEVSRIDAAVTQKREYNPSHGGVTIYQP